MWPIKAARGRRDWNTGGDIVARLLAKMTSMASHFPNLVDLVASPRPYPSTTSSKLDANVVPMRIALLRGLRVHRVFCSNLSSRISGVLANFPAG